MAVRKKKDEPDIVFTPEQVMSLRTLLRAYYWYSDEASRIRNWLEVKKSHEPKKNARPTDPQLLLVAVDRLEQVEATVKEFEKQVVPIVRAMPLWQHFLCNVKGCGEMMAALIVTEFDIHVATTVSKLWAFSGLATGMVRGMKYSRGEWRRTNDLIRRDRLTTGYKAPFNQFLRAKLIGVLGAGFIKCKSPYSQIYYDTRHRLESMQWGEKSKNPSDPKNPRAGHQHKAAMRKMVKEFLKDLYVAWRTMEGLPVREPYAEEYLGKVHGQFDAEAMEQPKGLKRAEDDENPERSERASDIVKPKEKKRAKIVKKKAKTSRKKKASKASKHKG